MESNPCTIEEIIIMEEQKKSESPTIPLAQDAIESIISHYSQDVHHLLNNNTRSNDMARSSSSCSVTNNIASAYSDDGSTHDEDEDDVPYFDPLLGNGRVGILVVVLHVAIIKLHLGL